MTASENRLALHGFFHVWSVQQTIHERSHEEPIYSQKQSYNPKIEPPKSRNVGKIKKGENPSCRKTQKNEGKFFPKKMSRNAEKTERGTLWSRLVLYVTRENFLVQFPGPTGAI